MPTRSEVKERYAHTEYPLHIIARHHLEITDAIKTYAVEKLEAKLNRYGVKVLDAQITFDIQKKINHMVDYILIVNNIKIKVSGLSDNMYASIDQAIDRLESKLTRYIKRIHEHRVKKSPEMEMNVNVIRAIDDINDQIEEENLKRYEEVMTPHTVVSKEKKALKTLTTEESIMKMDLSNDIFMIYKSEEDHKLKVIYRRNDGNYGIIEPE